jgi:Ca2+-binding EF-hand superfamily protein
METLEMTFRDFDKNQNGTLTQEELKAAFELYKVPATDTEIYDIFKKIDKNNDGVISFSEYCVAATT